MTDTDADGIPDYVETKNGTDPSDAADFADTDGDGVPDYVESKDGTNPNDATSVKDTDGDGLSDYDERRRGTDPTKADSDGDGVADSFEVTESSDPNDAGSFADTDGDGVPNQVEVADGTDPNDAASFLDTDGDGVSDYSIARGVPPQPRHCNYDFPGQFGASANRQEVARLYLALFRRQPDTAGLDYWTNLADEGASVSEIRSWMMDGTEFQTRYGPLDDTAFAAAIYNNFLCREIDATGATYWQQLLGNREVDRLTMISLIARSIEFATKIR